MSSLQLKPLRQQVIVISGASSGIGLATAQAAAARGARVVLAARNEPALVRITDKLKTAGGEATFVVADVGKRDQVQAIADTAVARFGGFDTWVNDAGVDIFGRLTEVSDADHHRLFATNFWGVVYGSLIAVEHLRRHGGALINVGSVESDVAIPLQGMYSASKHAVKGFSDALRMELADAGAPVSVTLVKPFAIGTPLRQHVKNYMPEEFTLPPPVYAPEEVADAILEAAEHPRRDIYVGGARKFLSAVTKPVPQVADWITEQIMYTAQFRDEPAHEHEDNLYQAGHADGNVRGEWSQRRIRRSFYNRVARNPVLKGVMMIGGVALAASALSRRDSPPDHTA